MTKAQKNQIAAEIQKLRSIDRPTNEQYAALGKLIREGNGG